MNDLELCKKIAEIEGVEFSVRGNSVVADNPAEAIKDKLTDIYNPLTNKALLFDLLVKYDVCICRYNDYVYIESDYTDAEHKAYESFSDEKDIPRAILECIVEANK